MTTFRWLSTIVFFATLLAAPWLYGGVLLKTQSWLMLATCIALLCLGISQLVRRGQQQKPPLAFALLALALVLGALQLVPLPSNLVGILSPGGHQLRSELLIDQPSAYVTDPYVAGTGSLDRRPISLRPELTRNNLALLVLAVAAFFLAHELITTRRQRLGMLIAVSINGAAFSFFGLVQLLAWNGRLYWYGLTPGGGSPFAAFACRNNAAGYLNLCLGAAFGLVVWTVTRHAASSPREKSSGDELHLRGRLLEPISRLSASRLTALILAGLIAGGVITALSRGGILSLFAAVLVTCVIVALTRRSRKRPLAWFIVAAIAGVGLVFWVGMGQNVMDRLSTLSDVEEQTLTGRVPLWKDSVSALPDFWPTGSGLGTFQEVYRPYQTRVDGTRYAHAENQFLEAGIEAGAPGFLLMLALIGVVSYAAYRLLMRPQRPVGYALGVTGAFALVSQIVHGCFDFGLYQPANFMLMATICGCVVSASGQSERLRDGDTEIENARFPKLRFASVLMALCLCVASLWGARELRTAASGEELLDETRVTIRPAGSSDSFLAEQITGLESHLDEHSDSADLHYRISRIWTLRYRHRKLDQLRRITPPDVTLETLWLQTSPSGLHRKAHQAGPQELDELRNEPMVQRYLRPALYHLLKAREAAPLHSMTHFRIGQLSWLYEDVSQDAKHLDRALKLRPSAPNLLIRVGALHFQAGRLEQAANTWQQALVIDDGNVGVHLDAIMTNGVDEDTLVHKVLPGSPGLLLTLANTRFSGPENSGSRQALFARAEDLIDQLKDDDERAYFRGRMLLAQGHPLQATRHYVQAVSGRPNMASWRFELATLLHQQGLVDEARKQARICVQLDPENPHYRALLETLSTK